jgi:hypothetical protein
MVKLLLNEFKQQKASKSLKCDFCFLGISKGSLYKRNLNTKLHEVCFRKLSLKSAKKNLENL